MIRCLLGFHDWWIRSPYVPEWSGQYPHCLFEYCIDCDKERIRR
jgi:hypothetical protein